MRILLLSEEKIIVRKMTPIPTTLRVPRIRKFTTEKIKCNFCLIKDIREGIGDRAFNTSTSELTSNLLNTLDGEWEGQLTTVVINVHVSR